MPKTVTKVPTELPKEITNLHKMFLETEGIQSRYFILRFKWRI